MKTLSLVKTGLLTLTTVAAAAACKTTTPEGASALAGDEVALAPASAAAVTSATSANSHCLDGTCYYMTVFATQLGTNPGYFQAGYSHTFASFVGVRDGDIAEQDKVEINWMPLWAHKEGWVKAGLAVPLEKGTNYPIAKTLSQIDAWNATHPDALRTVDIWGPFPIDPKLFAAAKGYKKELDSPNQTIRYKAIDRFTRLDPPGTRAINCFHAVSDVDMGIRRKILNLPDPANTGYLLRTGDAHGEDASRMVAFYLKPYVIGQQYTYAGQNEKVAKLMGLYDFDVSMNVRSNELFGTYDVKIDKLALANNGGEDDPAGDDFNLMGSVNFKTGLLKTGKAGIAYPNATPKPTKKMRVEIPSTCAVWKVKLEGFQALVNGTPAGNIYQPAVVSENPSSGVFIYDFQGTKIAGVTMIFSSNYANQQCNGVQVKYE